MQIVIKGEYLIFDGFVSHLLCVQFLTSSTLVSGFLFNVGVQSHTIGVLPK
jgi:hypothetical protein